MAGRELAKPEWKAYFDHLSKNLIGERAEVEIAGLALDHRVEARWAPLIGITYGSRDDILEIALEGLDHLIHRPRAIVITENSDGLESMEIDDSEGRKQLVKLMKPLRYPRRAVAS